MSRNVLNPGPIPRVHDVVPVLGCLLGEVPPPLDDEHAGITQLPLTRLGYFEAITEGCLIFAAAGESGATRLCFTNAAATVRSEDFRFVESCHQSLQKFPALSLRKYF